MSAARAADASGNAAEARDLYRAAIAADPSARSASQALARIRALDAILGPGDPALLELSAAQRAYATAGSEATIRRVEAALPTASPAVRATLELWLATEYADVAHDVDAANAHYLAVIEDPAAPPQDVIRAAVAGVRATTKNSHLRSLRSAIQTAALRDDIDADALATPIDEASDVLLRTWLRPPAVAAVVALIALAAVGRAWRHLGIVSPRVAAMFAYLGVSTAVLAERWEHGSAPTMLALAAALFVVHVLSKSAAPAVAAHPKARAALAATAAAASLGATFLVLDALGQQAIIGL